MVRNLAAVKMPVEINGYAGKGGARLLPCISEQQLEAASAAAILRGTRAESAGLSVGICA